MPIHHLHLTPPLRGSRWNIAAPWYGKTRMAWLLEGEKKFEDTFIRFDMIHERDRQRNGQTDSAPKLRPFVYFRIYSMQSIEETLLHCSTSRLRSTLWITKFCWNSCVLPSVTISCMVSVLSCWTHAARSLWRQMFYSYRHHLWYATRIVPRTDPFHYLYR